MSKAADKSSNTKADRSPASMASKMSDSTFNTAVSGLCSAGDYAGVSLKEEDQGYWWTASADCGGMGTTPPAYDWQCNQTVAQDCEAVSMQMVDSLNILCDWHSDYYNERHCRFLSVWLYCIDCIATCSALYSQALIRLFIAKNIYYIFLNVQCQ